MKGQYHKYTTAAICKCLISVLNYSQTEPDTDPYYNEFLPPKVLKAAWIQGLHKLWEIMLVMAVYLKL